MPSQYPNRALLTLPNEFIVKKSEIPNAGLGVWTVKNIPECVVIGPFVGEKVYKPQKWYKYGFEVCESDQNY